MSINWRKILRTTAFYFALAYVSIAAYGAYRDGDFLVVISGVLIIIVLLVDLVEGGKSNGNKK